MTCNNAPPNRSLDTILSRSWFRGTAAGLALLMGVAAGGCYGTFPLTNALYRANGNISDSTILNSIVMIILALFGAWGVCILVDAILLNSVEFWSGDDINISQSVTRDDGTTVTLAPGEAPATARLTVTREGQTQAEFLMVRDEGGVTTIFNEAGGIQGTVEQDGAGGFRFRDASGEMIGELDAEEIASRQMVAAGG